MPEIWRILPWESGVVPACAAVRLIGLLTAAGMVLGLSVPWRYRILFGAVVGGMFWDSQIATPSDPVSAVLCECGLGIVMGLSSGLLLGGFRLAGDLIDDRLRLGDATAECAFLGEESGGPCVRLLAGLAIASIAFGGTMPILEGVLSGYRQIPPGTAAEAWSTGQLFGPSISASLELALRTALPVLAAVSIIDWGVMVLLRVAPTAPSSLAGTAVRPLLGLAVLVATFGGVIEPVTTALEECLTGSLQ